MPAYLVEIAPYDPVAGAPVVLRATTDDDARVCGLNGGGWWPVLLRVGKRAQRNFDAGFPGFAPTPTMTLELDLSAWPDAARYSWGDRPIKLWAGEPGEPWPWAQKVQALVAAAGVQDGRIRLTLRPDDAWLDRPVLGLYAGTGGLEGPATLKGAVKPLSLGAPKYLPPQLIDTVQNVWQYHGGEAGGVVAALDRLVRYPASLGNEASLAALIAAPIAPGSFRTCDAQGLIRFGAPPAGPLTLIVEGGRWDAAQPRRAGALIRRVALLAGATAAQIDAANLALLDSAAPYNLSLYVSAQTTARELIARIAASVNGLARISLLGQLEVVLPEIGAPLMTLAADGSAEPQVSGLELLETGAPTWKQQMAGNVCWRVHGDGEYYEPKGGPQGPEGPAGPRGPAGPAAITMELSRAAASVWAYANGVVRSWAEASGKLTLTHGYADVTEEAELSAEGVGLVGTIDSAGNYAASAFEPGERTGTLVLTAIYAEKTYRAEFTVSLIEVGYEIVDALPEADLFAGREVFLTTDQMRYVYVAGPPPGWTNKIRAIQMEAFDFAGANLVADSSFGGGSWKLDISAGAGVGGSLTLQPGRLGGRAAEARAVATAGFPMWVYKIGAVAGGWPAGEWCVLSVYVRQSAGTPSGTGCKLGWNTPPAETVELHNPPRTAEWQRYAWALRWGSAVEAKGGIFLSMDGPIVPGDAVQFDDLQVERGQTLTAYVPRPSDLMPGSIMESHIGPAAITAPTIAANAVLAQHVAADQMDTHHMRAGAVTAAKLATTELITLSAQIRDALITDAKIANLSADKITAGTLSAARLLLDGQTVSNVGGYLRVSDAGINTPQLAANAAISPATYEGYGLFTCSSTSSAVVMSGAAASVTLTNATDYPATVPMTIAIFCEQNGSSSDLMTVALRSGGAVVSSWPVVTVSSGSSGTDLRNFQWSATIPAQSTVTYALFASSNDTTKIHRVSMQATMFKRA